MQHSFDVDIATQYGVNCAIILNHIWFWCEKNRANEKHYINGRYWTYNSIRAFEEIFPYMAPRGIRSALEKLIDEGLLLTGTFNSESYDRTKWYSISQKGQMLLSKMTNGLVTNDKPIPDINTDRDIINDSINNNISTKNNISYAQKRKMEIDDLFERLWKLYPKKMGKNDVTKTAKERLFKVGEEQMIRCIERYKKETEGHDKQYIMYGSTFFNKKYKSYLDENYSEYVGSSQEPEKDNGGGIPWQ